MFYRQDLRSYIFLDNDSEVTYFMEQFDLYRDIATRTGGDVYIGQLLAVEGQLEG